MTTIFLTNIISLQIPKLVAPLIKAFILKLIIKKDEKLVEHPFNKIDEEIERQLKLEPYQTNEEVDGSVNDYMELAIQFSYLSLFGLAFPACYILAFVQNVVKLQVDKYNFFNYSRRPFPQGASSIGNWLIIFEMISFLAIFTNAGLIVFTSEIIKENQVQVFSTLLIVFLTLKYKVNQEFDISFLILFQLHIQFNYQYYNLEKLQLYKNCKFRIVIIFQVISCIIRFLVPDEPAEAIVLNID